MTAHPGLTGSPAGPRSFNARVAQPARVYDYWLGGKDNFQADRIAGEETIAAYPAIRSSARSNRAFLARTVSYLAGVHGIRQFRPRLRQNGNSMKRHRPGRPGIRSHRCRPARWEVASATTRSRRGVGCARSRPRDLPSGLCWSVRCADGVPWLSVRVGSWEPAARTYSGQRRRAERHTTSFTQVNSYVEGQTGAYCKTVGSAYVGSNPTPATPARTASDLELRGRKLSSSQSGLCSQMPPEAATCRYSRDIRGMDLAGAGRRNDQDLADARYCHSAAEPDPRAQ